MDKDKVKTEFTQFLEQWKALFTAFTAKQEPPAEPAKEPAKESAPDPAKPAEPAKVEFDFAAEFKKITDTLEAHNTTIEGKFKEYDGKFTSYEGELKKAKDAIDKQNELIKKTNELFEKIPTALSTQKPKEGVKTTNDFFSADFQKQIEILQNTKF